MAKHFFPLFAQTFVLLGLPAAPGATVAGPSASPDNAQYVGSVGCQTSMCHGGASPSRGQFAIWSRYDFHSRAYATLVTPRSQRIAESLGIKSATEDTRCTICHAPLAALPPGNLDSTASATEGVSCENCHGGAERWLRGHTRPDWSYADRVHAGMRDLRSAFVRANTCVACHQVIDPALVKAGHPELTFELDGQDASEPRHWKEKTDSFGPKAWLTGQAVALREISRQISRERSANQDLRTEQSALVWLLSSLGVFIESPATEAAKGKESEYYEAWSNDLAQSTSGHEWKSTMTGDGLAALSATSASFTDNSVPLAEREVRAERLVLGLDRLFKSLHPEPSAPGHAELSALFDAVQDRDQFDAQKFASLLQKFANVATPKK